MECHHFAFCLLPSNLAIVSAFVLARRISPRSLLVAALARQMDEIVPEKRRNLNSIARRGSLDKL